jgi:hypothetical protein
MPQIRIFNPSSYTPRSYFAGGAEKGVTTMAKKRHHRTHRRRHNPLGISGGVVKDAAYVAAGAVGSPMLARMLGQAGWLNVAATAAAAVALSFAGKFVGGASAQEEILKGGLSATILAAVKESGMGASLGLGSYVPSYFAIPTASDPYGRVASPFAALPAAPARGGAMAGYNRYRSRFVPAR